MLISILNNSSFSHHRNLSQIRRSKNKKPQKKTMKVIFFMLIFTFYTVQVLGNIKAFLKDFSSFNGLSFLRLGTCDSTKCSSIPVHYQELGCKPIIKDGECCPSRWTTFLHIRYTLMTDKHKKNYYVLEFQLTFFFPLFIISHTHTHASFDCKHLDAKDDTKCHFKGKEINAGDSVDDDLLKSSCIGSAYWSFAAKFVYDQSDCAEFFGPPLQHNHFDRDRKSTRLNSSH